MPPPPAPSLNPTELPGAASREGSGEVNGRGRLPIRGLGYACFSPDSISILGPRGLGLGLGWGLGPGSISEGGSRRLPVISIKKN